MPARVTSAHQRPGTRGDTVCPILQNLMSWASVGGGQWSRNRPASGFSISSWNRASGPEAPDLPAALRAMAQNPGFLPLGKALPPPRLPDGGAPTGQAGPPSLEPTLGPRQQPSQD